MAVECSIVVPLFNEELNLPTLHLRLTATLRRLAIPFEIVYVDDGSTDKTAAIVRELHDQDPAIKAVLLSRNFGHQSALCAGLEAASGRAVITIDGDLQDPPELIPDLIDRWSDGFQIVYARRRRPEGLFRRSACYLLGRALRGLAEVSIPLDTGNYVLMDRSVVEQLNSLPERTRFIRGLRSWVGFRQAEVTYDREKRPGSASKYSFMGLTQLGLNGVFAFSEAPLKAVTISGAALFTAAAAVSLSKVLGMSQMGWTAISVVGLAGLQMLGMGILGEYIARIHQEVRGRPLYIARERLGFRTPPRPVRNVLEFLPSREAERQEQLTAGRLAADWSDPLLLRDEP